MLDTQLIFAGHLKKIAGQTNNYNIHWDNVIKFVHEFVQEPMSAEGPKERPTTHSSMLSAA